ncbi:hypothetical protein PsYK624_104130 [Phanerochaete sordida]|uniref:Uncharacterized protein n=1 Tax=Phanerochaete sordida TaxID=48140 RepID=A0A9P3GIG7_9APHY|nr:hypothetical protein PsYK624_104130 [Phanerochaete sordida]
MLRLPWSEQVTLIDEPLEDLLPDAQKVLAQIKPVFTAVNALDERYYGQRIALINGVKRLVAVLVQATADAADVINTYDNNNEGQEQLRHMIKSCSELQERMGNLLSESRGRQRDFLGRQTETSSPAKRDFCLDTNLHQLSMNKYFGVDLQ